MTDPEEIHIDCLEHGFAWECRVIVGDPERNPEIVVGVSRGEVEKYARGGTEPTALVEESFRFLLEREPASSILRRFNLSDIEHYYPEYHELILWRMAERQEETH